MNISKIYLFSSVLAFIGSSLNALCLDVENAPDVELCENSVCNAARLISQCGNVHYVAEEYEIGPEIWLFRVRFDNSETEMGEEFAIEVRPSDPIEIPMTMLDGHLVRLLDGAPITQTRAQQISCVPIGYSDSCNFIDSVLSGLN